MLLLLVSSHLNDGGTLWKGTPLRKRLRADTETQADGEARDQEDTRDQETQDETEAEDEEGQEPTREWGLYVRLQRCALSLLRTPTPTAPR